MTTAAMKYSFALVSIVVLKIIASISDVGGADAECNCAPITPRQGVALTCKNSQGNTIDCSSPAPPLTSIDYKCHSFYRPVLRGIVHRQLQCSQDCTWQNIRRLEEFICEIDCGKPYRPHIPFIAYGQKTLRYSWPWHATLFVKNDKTLRSHYICGGTLISEHVVLTAAHCLITPKEFSLESYHVVLGAISSNWTENTSDTNAQFFTVKGIYVSDEYDPVEHRSDIGLMELDHSVVLSEAVSPACFPYDNDILKPQEPVVVGEGEVVGYGKNENGDYERYLKYASLPVLGAAKCYELLQNRQGVEQFCAGVENGSAVCNGDSGGGMVFKGQGMSRYYVQGIVSHGLSTREKVICDGISYFTNVLHFTRWVADIVDGIREKNEWIPHASSSTTSSPNPVVPTYVSISNTGITDETTSHIPPTQILPRNDDFVGQQCGIPSNHSKIKNLPWNVVLYQKSRRSGKFEYFCGGVLISDKAVLTAAHCVTHEGKTRDPSEIILYFGKLYDNGNSEDENVQMRKVERIYADHRYPTIVHGYDIAILIPDKTIEITGSVRPACLSSRKDFKIGEMGTIIGYGRGRITAQRGLETTIPIAKCVNKYVENEDHITNSICAGYEDGTSVCGVGGGGLYIEDASGRWELSGIISEGFANKYGECEPRGNTVFIVVAYHRDWIQEVLEIYKMI